MSDQQPKPKLVQSDTVVRVTHAGFSPPQGQTFVGSQAADVMSSVISQPKKADAWSKNGVACEALSPGGEWVKGKVQFVMVFTPDEMPTE